MFCISLLQPMVFIYRWEDECWGPLNNIFGWIKNDRRISLATMLNHELNCPFVFSELIMSIRVYFRLPKSKWSTREPTGWPPKVPSTAGLNKTATECCTAEWIQNNVEAYLTCIHISTTYRVMTVFYNIIGEIFYSHFSHRMSNLSILIWNPFVKPRK